jgi:MraZ protein
MRGFDQNLNLLTFASFRVISERINRMSLTDPNARQLRRLIYSDAASVEFDKTGRILIPQFLREAADINDEAVIVGAGIYVEIWSPKLWTAQRDQLNDVKVTAEQFAVFDLPAE